MISNFSEYRNIVFKTKDICIIICFRYGNYYKKINLVKHNLVKHIIFPNKYLTECVLYVLYSMIFLKLCQSKS